MLHVLAALSGENKYLRLKTGNARLRSELENPWADFDYRRFPAVLDQDQRLLEIEAQNAKRHTVGLEPWTLIVFAAIAFWWGIAHAISSECGQDIARACTSAFLPGYPPQ